MTINADLFVTNPIDYRIPNDGVSKVSALTAGDAGQWDVLRYELMSFYCDGEYDAGLQRMLDSYLANAARSTQPAAWVSGFYGSGKSHLVRVFEHLWMRTAFPDGADARGLTTLPPGITTALRELDAVGERFGARPWAVAGVLDAEKADSLNLTFLAIVLRAAGLPEKVAPARIALWLRAAGLEDAVREHLEAAGRDYLDEVRKYNLSTPLAEAILAAEPGFASSPGDVKLLLKNQYPTMSTLDTSETVTLLREVLLGVGQGHVPPTLVVLDEVQQFIGSDSGRGIAVQNLVEALSAQFEGRLFVVATGQSELSASPELQKIQDRFSVRVHLRNQDVDAVIRRVLLEKRPAGREELLAALERTSGEISRELAGTTIAPTAADQEVLAEDYPLLPGRRRFWDGVLRAADLGRSGQLRSQLRIVHEANQSVADRPLGHVVGADFLYDQKSEDLLSAGLLMKEVQHLIAEQGALPDGALRARVLRAVALIALLPSTGIGDLGVRANAVTIADLLVEDLAADGAPLRRDVPQVLGALATEGLLQDHDGEYRLQTKVGREWEETYRHARSSVGDSDFATEREHRLEAAVRESLPRSVPQGRASVPRTLSLVLDGNQPDETDGVVVWVRSAWTNDTEKQAEERARALGSASSLVLAWLPRLASDRFRDDVLTLLAATRTLEQRASSADDEGRAARAAMENRRARAAEKVAQHVRETIDGARVWIAGGAEIDGATLRIKATSAAARTLPRRFTEFEKGDDARWDKVIRKLNDGAEGQALLQVGHTGEASSHAVVSQVRSFVGRSTPAREVIDRLKAAPYGWADDAIRSGIAVLVAEGLVHASLDGVDVGVTKYLTLGVRPANLLLRAEAVPLTTSDRIQARSLLGGLGVAATNENLVERTGEAIVALSRRAELLSGPAPLPAVALPPELAAVNAASSNTKVRELLLNAEVASSFYERLAVLEGRRAGRVAALTVARDLAEVGAEVPAAEAAIGRLREFEAQRTLLDTVDGISPVVQELADALREAYNEVFGAYTLQRTAVLAELEADPAWQAVDPSVRSGLLTGHKLDEVAAPALTDPSRVLAALRARGCREWGEARLALAARADAALSEARKVSEPQAAEVRLPRPTVRTEAEVDAYLDAVRATLLAALEQAPAVVIR